MSDALTLKTIYVLVEIAVAPWLTERETLYSPQQFPTEQACRQAHPSVGVYGATDLRVIVCRRVNLLKEEKKS